MDHDDFTDEKVQHLIETGCLTPVGFDEDGDRLFVWNPERLAEVEPELFSALKEEAQKETDDALKGLLDKGLVDLEYDDSEHDFNIIFTEDGEKWAAEQGIEIID